MDVNTPLSFVNVGVGKFVRTSSICFISENDGALLLNLCDGSTVSCDITIQKLFVEIIENNACSRMGKNFRTICTGGNNDIQD